ncbi:MAG TPA: hypothetical protein VD704_01735 [Gaiellaceae bacterium]|nr:hypothetical protein [Gaiellaceae bacterium]
MTDHVVRLYAVALSLVVLFLTWAAVAARPWEPAAGGQDPRVVALERREAALRRRSAQVERAVERRFARYERRLRARERRIASVRAAGPVAPAVAAPAVGLVSLPPVTSSGSS